MKQMRLRLLLVVAIVALAGTDFWGRIYVPRDLREHGAGSFVPVPVPEPVPAELVRKDLADWFPTLQPLPGSDVAVGPSGWTVSLLGIFQSGDAEFAVLRATPAAGGPGKVQSVAVGDEIHGQRVVRIEPKRVILSDGAIERDLLLFERTAGRAVAVDAAPDGLTAALPSSQRSVEPQAPVGSSLGGGPARAVAAQELQAGEAIQLPAGMPVVEAKLPPPGQDKKKVRPPPRPKQLQNP